MGFRSSFRSVNASPSVLVLGAFLDVKKGDSDSSENISGAVTPSMVALCRRAATNDICVTRIVLA